MEVFNTLYAGIGVFYWANLCLLSNISGILTAISWFTEPTRHVGTHVNAFLMVIPNMVMKFHNFDIFYNIFYNFLTRRQHSPAACKVLTLSLLYHLSIILIDPLTRNELI